ncbi:hypothetical protein A4H97_20065 [Niastella yeongjuensis]|uniref:Secretin/TonB short N-terminal domain-containing protein n=1 Tax=Niastella yeongjuensis TaxID=354355 RepID=A0A1V9FBX3_9BACT|nr:SusC/RagA family TonB-linked outer membrane protein [Niastella yeongjuensis]OQP55889.1 hypothetical protein A4H97_20065 [Niastella yeongjuensis]SEP27642.1 TonB-linked outer membrane protein, SusC/RagA family [Niastella yeongjuensis]
MTDFISGKAAIAGCKPVLYRLKWELTKTLRIMKLAAFFLFAAAMHVSAKGLTQEKITLSLKNAPLEKVFNAIENQSGFVFIYKNETVKDKKVSIQVTNVSLAEALDECLRGQALLYQIVGKSVAIKTAFKTIDLVENETANAPPLIDVKGKVLNEKGDPVEGVTVRVKGSEKFTLTDKNGEFSLVTVERDAVLLFTHITMDAFELKVSGQTELLIKLRTKVSSLGEVVVSVNTGYQQVSKERFVGSVSTLDSAAYNRRAGMDILSRLDGTVTGILFDKKGSSDNPLQNITIRGISTLDNLGSPSKAPLIIVDNFPFRQDLSAINPNDVESVNILKDAAAASIWGAQAGNGVIVITTKKGKYNQPLHVSVASNITMQEKPDQYYYPQMRIADFIDAEIFLFNKGRYDADFTNAELPVVSPVVELLNKRRAGIISAADSASQIDAMKQLDLRRDLDKYAYRQAISQQHYININGGNSSLNYSFAAGYNKNLNNVRNSKPDDQFTINTTAGMRVAKGLEVNTGVFFTQGKQRSTNFSLPSKTYPYAQLADAEGNALALPFGRRLSYTDTAGDGNLLDWKYRPLDETGLTDIENNTRAIILNLGATYKVTNWLSAAVSYQYSNNTSNTDNYHGLASYYTRNLINLYTNLNQSNADLRNPIPIGAILEQSMNESVSQNVRAQLNFNKRFGGRHNLSGMLATDRSETKASGNVSRYYNYNKENGSYKSAIDYLTVFPLSTFGNQQIPPIMLVPGTNNRFVSFLGNASYSYNDRYNLYASARKEGSNVFGVNTNKKWKPLWSAGASWDLSKENFYHISWMPNMRVKFSYGYTGSPGTASGLPTIIYGRPADYTNLPSASPNDPPNPDLRWEKIRTINTGVDFGLFNNRVTGTIDVFQKRATDLIAPTFLAPSTGVNLYTINVASLKGNGYELNVTSKNFTGDFTWQTHFGLSYSKTIVEKLFVNNPATSYFVGYGLNAVEGKVAYGLGSYKWEGLDPATGDPRGRLGKEISTNYTAIFNDSIQNQVFHGSAQPLYSGFIGNSFSWKNLTFSANITYRLQFYFRKPTISYSDLANNWNGHADYGLRWQKPGDEMSTTVPSFTYPTNTNRDLFYKNSEINVLRGDNVRLQDVRLQYVWNENKKKHLPFKSLNVFVYVNNINVILWRKNDSDLDPDFVGGAFFMTPTPVSWTGGININF